VALASVPVAFAFGVFGLLACRVVVEEVGDGVAAFGLDDESFTDECFDLCLLAERLHHGGGDVAVFAVVGGVGAESDVQSYGGVACGVRTVWREVAAPTTPWGPGVPSCA